MNPQILVDDRAGSRELKNYFHPFGVIVQLSRLEFGDLAFAGNGPEGMLSIGVERKTISDLIQSMETGRLQGHQLRGLLKTYDVTYLVVEGIWRPGPGGELEICHGNGGWRSGLFGKRLTLYEGVDNFCTSVELCGVKIRRTANPTETAKCVVDLYRWWEKDWEAHKSPRDIYAPVAPESTSVRLIHPDPPNLVVRMASQIEGIDLRAWQVGKFFPNAVSMVSASVEEWMQALGIKKSRVTAEKVVKELYGRPV